MTLTEAVQSTEQNYRGDEKGTGSDLFNGRSENRQGNANTYTTSSRREAYTSLKRRILWSGMKRGRVTRQHGI